MVYVDSSVSGGREHGEVDSVHRKEAASGGHQAEAKSRARQHSGLLLGQGQHYQVTGQAGSGKAVAAGPYQSTPTAHGADRRRAWNVHLWNVLATPARATDGIITVSQLDHKAHGSGRPRKLLGQGRRPGKKTAS